MSIQDIYATKQKKLESEREAVDRSIELEPKFLLSAFEYTKAIANKGARKRIGAKQAEHDAKISKLCEHINSLPAGYSEAITKAEGTIDTLV